MGEAAVKGHLTQERERKTKIFREFGGVFTRNSRNACPDGRFYDLVNLMPIGDANLHTLPAPFVTSFNSINETAYWGQYVNLNNTDYLLLFMPSGKVYAYNEATDTSALIFSGLSGSGSRCTQWKNSVALFIDSTGYYVWNGSTFLKISNGNNGAPSSGQDIAVAFGRVFIAQGRILYYSAQDDYGINLFSTVNAWAQSTVYAAGQSVVALTSGNIYICTVGGTSSNVGTGPTGTGTGIVDGSVTWNFVSTCAWTTANGSSFINLTDPLLRSIVQRLWAQNGYLYIFGATSMFIISNMFVPQGASPPIPVYTNLPIDPIIGTDQPASVFGLSRDLMFATKYGAFNLSGIEADRVSRDIDGTWQYLDFTKPISGGMCVIWQLPCACFLINQLNDPTIGSRNVVAVYFDKKWFFSSTVDTSNAFNPLYATPPSLLIPCVFNNKPTIYAVIGTNMVRLFDNYTLSPPSSLKTPLWPMDDSLADKQALRGGVEINLFQLAGQFQMYADTTNGSFPFVTPTPSTIGIQWVNNAGSVVNWVNNANAVVYWFSNAYVLYSGSAPGLYQKYAGLSMAATPAPATPIIWVSQTLLNPVAWQNNSAATVQWQNNSLANVQWQNNTPQFQNTPVVWENNAAQIVQWISGLTWGPVYQASQLMLDYGLGARW